MRKKTGWFKRLWYHIRRWFKKVSYKTFRNFQTNPRILNVFMLTVLVGILLLIIVFVPYIRNLWQDFFGALTNTLLGIFIGSLYVLVRVFFEDQHKVTQDPNLIRHYYGTTYDVSFRLSKYGDLCRFIYDATPHCKISEVVFKTNTEPYELPEFVSSHFSDIFSAHRGSYKTNYHTVKINRYEVVGEKLTLHVQRSTFYNHLVTNRAIDLPINKSVTIRDMLEPGPVLNALEKSKLSNHLGVIGLVLTSDGDMIIPHRSKTATTSKNKLTSTLAYGLTVPNEQVKKVDSDVIKTDQFYKDLYKKVESITYIKEEEIHETKIVGIGRDVFEGGKPHLFLVLTTTLSTNGFIEAYHTRKKLEFDNVNDSAKKLKELRNDYRKQLNKFIKTKNPTEEFLESMNQFENETLIKQEELVTKHAIEQNRKALDKVSKLYIVSPKNIGFIGHIVTIKGQNLYGKTIDATFGAESSLLMNLKYYVDAKK